MKDKSNILLILIGLTLFFSFIGTCSSCNNKNAIKQTELKLKNTLDSLSSTMYTKEQMDIALQIQGLEDERRTVLNINQIFLTKKRPDERVIEIDNEIKRLKAKTK